MNATRLVAAAFALLSTAAVAAPPEPPPGAVACSGCHTIRSSVKTTIPPIHGRAASDIVTAMSAFRTGARPSTVMDRIAKGFTDDETALIATWLEAQKPGRGFEQHK